MADETPPLVLADFNGLLGTNALNLEVAGVRWDLARLNLKIHEGMRLRAFDLDLDAEGDAPDNLIAEGVAERITGSSGRPRWVLILDYFAHESEMRHNPDHWANHVNWSDELQIRERWRREHSIETNAWGGHQLLEE